ncbi:hypothetical protein ABKN59_004350 [Abortiporus biennis]
MTQTRVVMPESPTIQTYKRTHTQSHPPSPSWYYREGSIRQSYSRSSGGIGGGSIRRSPTHSPGAPRRTRTSTSHDHSYIPNYSSRQSTSKASSNNSSSLNKPWEHMAQTYAWVLEQEIAEMTRKNDETVRWVLKQQERDVKERTMHTILSVENKYRQMMDDLVDEYQREAERWKAREEATRRSAMRWQRELERTVEEEFRRLQAKRREAERYRMAYDRRRAEEAAKERERRRVEREHEREEAQKDAWKRYEEAWSKLNTSTDELTFEMIPWPMFSPPQSVDSISPARVAMFFLSPVHVEDQPTRDRIKAALRRWHPDRFGRVLSRVKEDDKANVEEGAGIVVRCLNNLLERESANIPSIQAAHV